MLSESISYWTVKQGEVRQAAGLGCSGTWALQKLLYCDNWKIWLKLLTDNKMQREACARTAFVFLAYSSLRMEVNLWAWIYILGLVPVVLILYPSMELNLMSKL